MFLSLKPFVVSLLLISLSYVFWLSHIMICFFTDGKALKNIEHWKSDVRFQHRHSSTEENTELKRHGFNGIEFCSKFETPINL